MGLISNGTTIFDAGAMSLGGSMVFIKKLTASSSATLSFVDGASGVVLDNTYKEYLFTFKNIHIETDAAEGPGFQADTGTNTNYNQQITSTFFHAAHRQDDVVTELGYDTGSDQANGTNFQRFAYNLDSSQASDNLCGTLRIFNPSSNTFVKHFTSTFQYTYDGDGNEQYSLQTFVSGYFNQTSPLTRFQFKMESGNIDAGDICLYGIN